MSVISHACIAYRDDTKRFSTVACKDIKLKRNSKCSIAPKDDSDFDRKYVYYAKWQYCDDECSEDCDEHVGYYPAFILLLGESEADIEGKKAERRLIVPIIKDSSESEELFQPLPKKFKYNNSIQDAKSQKNVDILSKYNCNLMLSSRKRLNELDFVGDEVAEDIPGVCPEVENTNPKKKDVGLKRQTRYQLKISKDQEIQELQAKLLELQEAPDHSQRSPRARGSMKADVDAVKRNLFQEDAGNTEETNGMKSGIQSKIHSGGSSTVMSLKPSKPTVKSVEKVCTTNMNLRIKSERSKPTSNDHRMEKSGRHDQQRNREGFESQCIMEFRNAKAQGGTSLEVSGSTELTSKMTEKKSVKSPMQEHDQNSHEEGRKSAESDHGTEEDEEEAEDDRHVICRLQPKIKQKKSADHGNGRINKKNVKEIEAALKHYELGIDHTGKTLYEVTDKRIYLGEGINMSVTAWYLIQHKKASIFLNDVILLLWGERTLVNRCQNEAKVTTKLADRSPMKELTPSKKRLLYKLYNDHLDDKKVSLSDRMRLLKKIPETLTTKINNLRKKYYR